MPLSTLVDGIIFQSNDHKFIVLDIPASIAAAQNGDGSKGSRVLVSCTPLSIPFASTEPKSRTAIGHVKNHDIDDKIHDEYVAFIQDVRERASCSVPAPLEYCYKRVVMLETSEKTGMKRKMHSSPLHADGRTPPQECLDSSDRTSDDFRDSGVQLSELLSSIISRLQPSLPPLATGALGSTPSAHGDADIQIDTDSGSMECHNGSSECFELNLTDQTSGFTEDFRVPRGSGFLLGNCDDTRRFRSSARRFLSAVGRSRFNFVLLDPPWPNRSARRRSSYVTQPNMGATKDMLLSMDLDTQIEPGGYVAVWITNRPAVRECVLGAGGLFEAWNVSLTEEWIWLKVTSSGEPVYPLNGQWRKPYEVLLIGKRPADAMAIAQQSLPVTRRLLVAVPDLHSRKPSVKTLVEHILLPHTPGFVGLEIFARYLTADWFSWGNEVLKYNADCFWKPCQDEIH